MSPEEIGIIAKGIEKIGLIGILFILLFLACRFLYKTHGEIYLFIKDHLLDFINNTNLKLNQFDLSIKEINNKIDEIDCCNKKKK